MLLLLYLYNPVVSSLRAIQQASQLKNVQKKLRCPRAALGSLSEATTVFDPEALREVMVDLAAQLEPMGRDRLNVGVDGRTAGDNGIVGTDGRVGLHGG